MQLCFIYSELPKDESPSACERVAGVRHGLEIVRLPQKGPFYPHIAEELSPDIFRFFAGHLTGVSPSQRFPENHPVAENAADSWTSADGEPDGSWIALKFDRRRDLLSIAADPFNVQRWFFCHRGEKWYISNTLLFLFSVCKEDMTVESLAIPYLLQLGYLPRHLTPLRDVFGLDAGFALTIDRGKANLSRRTILPVFRRPVIGGDDYSPLIASVLVEAVKREVESLDRIMIPLSGGVDSRFLLGCALDATDPQRIVTMTFGEENSLDRRIGVALSRKLGVQNVSLEMDRRPMEQILDDNFATAEGLYWTVPDYPVQFFRQALWPEAFVLSGFLGDPVFGSKEGEVIPDSGETPTAASSSNSFLEAGESVPYKEIRPLLNLQTPDPLGIESLLRTTPGSSPQETFDFWYFGAHSTNRTLFAVMPSRDRACYLMPFIHRRVLDVAFSLPTEARRDQSAYFDALKYRYPELSSFPTKSNFGFPLDTPLNSRVRMVRAWRKMWSGIDEFVGRPLGMILYHHPRDNYAHPRELYRKIHRAWIVHALESLKASEVFSSKGLDEMKERYLRRERVNIYLLRGLLTVHQWMKHYSGRREI